LSTPIDAMRYWRDGLRCDVPVVQPFPHCPPPVQHPGRRGGRKWRKRRFISCPRLQPFRARRLLRTRRCGVGYPTPLHPSGASARPRPGWLDWQMAGAAGSCGGTLLPPFGSKSSTLPWLPANQSVGTGQSNSSSVNIVACWHAQGRRPQLRPCGCSCSLGSPFHGELGPGGL
jgi:hypothetical protein